MPAYEYACGDCGEFQTSRPVAEAAMPQACPECGELAPRALARPHVRTAGAAIRYVAESRNERSANEPPTEHRFKGTTGPQRPWMIGH